MNNIKKLYEAMTKEYLDSLKQAEEEKQGLLEIYGYITSEDLERIEMKPELVRERCLKLIEEAIEKALKNYDKRYTLQDVISYNPELNTIQVEATDDYGQPCVKTLKLEIEGE